MPDNYLSSPIEFLVSTLFSLYILAVMLRFFLQQVKADFYNPISQFVVKVTNPPLRPLRRLIPGYGGIDIASLVLLLALQMLMLGIIVLLRDSGIGIYTLFILSLAELVGLAFNIFLFAVIIQAILSWVNPDPYNPVSNILASLTAPILRPLRRLIPPVSGIDLTPIGAIIAIQLAKMLVVPLIQALAGI